DDRERQQRVDEGAVGELAAIDGEAERREVRLVADGADDRRDQVGDQGLDNGVEGDADDHRDGQLDEIAPEQELLEAAHGSPWLRWPDGSVVRPSVTVPTRSSGLTAKRRPGVPAEFPHSPSGRRGWAAELGGGENVMRAVPVSSNMRHGLDPD